LVEDLKDPEFLRAYITESVRLETIDRLVNELDVARTALGLSEAELARVVGSGPAVIRRLLSSEQRNPTIGTVVDIAAALGYKVGLVPMEDGEREVYAETLRAGTAKNPEEVARKVQDKRAAKGA